MKKVNRIHKNMRSSLLKLDANELIRIGVMDFMKALGKSDEYSKNVGSLCKKIASKMKLGSIIWDDTKENPLQINKQLEFDCKNSYSSVYKGLQDVNN